MGQAEGKHCPWLSCNRGKKKKKGFKEQIKWFVSSFYPLGIHWRWSEKKHLLPCKGRPKREGKWCLPLNEQVLSSRSCRALQFPPPSKCRYNSIHRSDNNVTQPVAVILLWFKYMKKGLPRPLRTDNVIDVYVRTDRWINGQGDRATNNIL